MPWLNLKFTASAGDIAIIVEWDQTLDSTRLPLDWLEGEEFVISSSDFSGSHSEKRTILKVSNPSINPIITFEEPLLYTHYAEETDLIGERKIKTTAEVAILSRNVKIQGDSKSTKTTQQGAVFIVHDVGSIARIDSVEFNHVGQAAREYKYPIHFHMVDDARFSYIKNCVIKESYARAIGLSGVKNLLVENNVVFDIEGHGILSIYGTEKDNTITQNLVIKN